MSAPKYKLNYFNACGKAEVIRWILVYADQDFEDHRLEMIDWLRLKPTAPFGTLPFLEIDGKTLGGSLSVQRYLAKRFGLAGKDPFEEAQIDSVVEFISDARLKYPSWVAAAIWEENHEKADLVKKTYLSEAVGPLKSLEKFLLDNSHGDGFIMGSNVTWADFVLCSFLDTTLRLKSDFLDTFPILEAYRARICELEKIKAWLQQRPETMF